MIPSSSLIPENDPTTLFISAGMHPLVPFLMGEKHPSGNRLTDVQKCIRTGDIDEVGDNWHLTFFEMLGNWSLGDYFKKEAIEWSWEFLTSKKYLGIDPEKIFVSVFAGDEDAPRDEESAQIWQSVGVPKERIFYYPKSDNWWGPAGRTGPCGPDTEMYYDAGRPACGPNCEPRYSCGKYSEIWNDVFMQYNKTADGKYEPLKQKNVDTGMGLERTTAVLNGYDNVYETDVFQPLIKKLEELAGKSYQTTEQIKCSMRIIADHLRAATFILGDNLAVAPSNEDQGYVLRRLIRRSIRHGKMIGIDKPFTHLVAEVVIDLMSDVYEELKRNKNFIVEQLVREEEKFTQTLERGLKEFSKIATQDISAKNAFYLYESFGFPLEMTVELAREQNLKVDEKGFEEEFKKHQELSRQGAQAKFAGGLADHSEQVTKYHTATHLLHQALRQVLGDHVAQKGSNITEKRLRFDFTHGEKMTPEQIKQVEEIVNQKIKENLPVACEEMTVGEAKQKGAIGLFEHKYGDKVKVYTIGDFSGIIFSKEICGGPHVGNTGALGHFKIIKEESSSAGVRRIKFICVLDLFLVY